MVKGLVKNVFSVLGRIIMPDEETLQEIAKQRLNMYNTSQNKKTK